MNIRTKIGQVIKTGRNFVAVDKARHGETDRRAARSMVLMALCVVAVAPGVALAGGGSPWDSMGDEVLAIFTGGLTRTIAIISVIACGIAALAGKLSWDWAIKIIVGIVLIFGGASLVDYLIAAAS
ncbi:TrbC/VirB2 family protein [Massilia sp. H6]|uniref:TrbC/VirB2 family protein n=1 Tax=Massilia sp. H6 TaxID=2970464 RepID=UPI0021699360|nr:TrbC/VirB2 family protein [Massilia sp. H6]UVW30680.1 TrbC/VirB2 family protein [Massilia sp. H6]